MAVFSIDGLQWLRPAPEDFRSRVKALVGDDRSKGAAVSGAELADLANHALDLNRLTQLDRALTRISGGSFDPGTLTAVRLAILADTTTDFIAPAIRASGLRHGILTETYLPSYGQTMHEVLNPTSGLAAFGADMVLLVLDHRNMGLNAVHMAESAAQEAVAAAAGKTEALLDGLARMGTPNVILQTLPIPPDPWCGHHDRRAPGSIAAQISAFNDRLSALASSRNATLLDVAALADLVGRSRWFDPGQWHRAKLPFSLDWVPLYADHVARVAGALRGKARKCLVLDLDNTCWGGVIGDDGLEGIRIGQGTAEGEAFLAIQSYALQLNARGIVLAVCSKNDEATARLPFREHPDMVLREEDIAVFVANWTDKATNIRDIARRLNIGTDALVFVDDNPAERARVRQMLPEVAVPELPDDPALYPTVIAQAGYFETTGLSADDAKRAGQYRANAERERAQEVFGDYDAYLASLDMVCDLRPFDEIGRTRIAQLINKSNQFNLTTRRYSEADVARMQQGSDYFTLQVRLTDRFGDNGMISVVVFRKDSTAWHCDTWLMSCRVLGRRIEEAVLAAVARAALAEGIGRLTGEYIPSPKNQMVAGHFGKLGFARISEAADGHSFWQLDLADYTLPDLPMAFTGPLAERLLTETAPAPTEGCSPVALSESTA